MADAALQPNTACTIRVTGPYATDADAALVQSQGTLYQKTDGNIRATPAFTPLIMNGLVAAFDATVPASLLKTGGSAAGIGEAVATINCAIGSAYQLTQATASAQWTRASGAIIPPASPAGYALNNLSINTRACTIMIVTSARTDITQNMANRTPVLPDGGIFGVLASLSVDKFYAPEGRYGGVWTEDAVNVNIYCFDTAATTAHNSMGNVTTGANTAGTVVLSRLLATGGGSFAFYAPVKSVLIFNRVLTDAEVARIRTYLTIVSYPMVLCAVGDSITQGVGATAANCWTTLTRNALSCHLINCGNSGDTLVARKGAESGLLNGTYVAGKSNVMILAMGTNDLAANASAATLEANFTTYINARHAAHSDWQILPATILPRTAGFTGGADAASFETQRGLFNAWVRANFTHIADYGDLPVALADGIHPNVAGHAVIAACVTAAINAL